LVLAWWHRYLERDSGFRRRHEGALTPSGAGPPDQRERALDLALLDLFIDPTGASRSLDRLARQGLQQTIRARLGEFAASARGATAIRRMRFSSARRKDPVQDQRYPYIHPQIAQIFADEKRNNPWKSA